MFVESQEQAVESPEELWALEEKIVEEKLLETFDFAQLKNWGYSEKEIEEKKREIMEKEKKFFINVLAGVEAAGNGSEKVKVLFDIDETIGAPEFASEKIFTALRPSLIPLMEKIRELGAEMGFITDRGEKIITKQLDDEDNLLPIKKFISPELIFSSRKFNPGDDREFREKMMEEFGGENGIIDENISYEGKPILGGDQVKLRTLKEIRKKLKDDTLVIIDDLNYPNYLNAKNNLSGVSVKDAMFTRP